MYHILLFISLYTQSIDTLKIPIDTPRTGYLTKLDWELWNKIIMYAPYRILKWTDYKGLPDRNSVLIGKIAFTVTEWSIHETVDNGKIYFNLSQRFVAEKSWTITNSESVLRHEKTHYLISMLWLNKCMQKITKYNGTSEKNRTRAYIIYNHCWKEYRQLQALFDKETAEGQRPNMERQWEEQIINDVK